MFDVKALLCCSCFLLLASEKPLEILRKVCYNIKKWGELGCLCMKTILKRLSAALAVMAAVVFDLSAKTASAASCSVDHPSATQLTEEPEQLTDGSYYLGASIVLTKDIVIEGNVTLCLNGNTITAANDSRVFTITNSGSLTICDCGNTGKITGGKANEGGGVYVSSGGTFTMNGGTVSENEASHQGGGVFVSGGGTFAMNGGEISGNTATGSGETDGGGGVYTAGTFTMSGDSKISDNKAEKCYGGGVCVSGSNAKFTLKNGTLSGNSANFGGGVHVSANGLFEMNGGKIGDANSAASGGGGISLGGGNSTMSGGMISNNTAKYGGGAFISVGELTMNNGAAILSNKAERGGDGGGVYLSGGKLTMNNGATLSNNKADSNGGGVFLNTGDFTMRGGSISSNTAENSGSCVYMGKENGGGTMTLSGAVTITSNKDSNVYLADGKTITIGSGFSTGSKIGIHPEKPPENCLAFVPVTNFADGASATDISNKFKADKDKQVVVYSDYQVNLMGEHSFNNSEWENDADKHWHICAMCDKEVGKAAHRWDGGTVIKQPTQTEAGERMYTCLDCKLTKTEPLPFRTQITAATPNSQIYPEAPDNNGESRNAVNDDDPPTGISLSLAPPALAIAAITALLIRRKK